MNNSLLPPNATPLMRDLEQAMSRIGEVPVPIRDLWNPDNCPEPLLPWLAWAYGVEQWESSWTVAQKRAVLNSALFVQRYKGTRAAIARALSVLGYQVKIIEWWQENPRRAPYTFRIEILAPEGVTPELYARTERLINSAKNLRSHITALQIGTQTRGPVYVGGALQCIDNIRIGF